MREIKFRIWHPVQNRMYQVEKERYIASCGIIDDYAGCREMGNVWMQYTGLKDKNGKEIYEGDIVKDRFDRIMKVGYHNYRLCWIAITETNFHHADFFDWVNDDEDGEFNDIARVEVIGNIYEHPELLKSQGDEVSDTTKFP